VSKKHPLGIDAFVVMKTAFPSQNLFVPSIFFMNLFLLRRWQRQFRMVCYHFQQFTFPSQRLLSSTMGYYHSLRQILRSALGNHSKHIVQPSIRFYSIINDLQPRQSGQVPCPSLH